MSRRLAYVVLLLACVACNDDDDHPSADAAVPVSDAGTPAASPPDASAPDASAPDASPAAGDAGIKAITSCLDLPGDLPMPPSSALNCDLLPPDLAR